MRLRGKLGLSLSALVAGSALVATIASAQPVGPDAPPVGQGSGPLSEISRPPGEGRPVSSGRGPTLGESSGIVHSPPVGGSSIGSMISPAVSDDSGPVSPGRPMTGGGSMTENSAGAVKKDIDSPLGEPIASPIHDLGPLQARLKALQQQLSLPSAQENAAVVVAQEGGTVEEEPLDGGNDTGAGAAPQAEPQGGAEAPGENPGEPPSAAEAPQGDDGDAAEEIHQAPPPNDAAPAAGEHEQQGGDDDLPAEGF